MAIPQFDMSKVSIDLADDRLNDNDVRSAGIALKKAFMEWGFVYLTHHGISSDQVAKLFKISKDFFELPREVKGKYPYSLLGPRYNFGYVDVGVETLDETVPADIKEAFDMTLEVEDESLEPWPVELPQFKIQMQEFYQSCAKLTKRVLHLIGVSLELDDPFYFVKTHNLMGKRGNATGLRTLFYPSVQDRTTVLPGQVRCSEHSDYGTITLLFQDSAGGLLVKSRDGTFVPATPVKDAVLINIADLLQRWTNDELISVRHKVVVPEEEVVHKIPRQSIAFFAQPDNHITVECIKGSNKYPPVNAYEYLLRQLEDTYGR